MQPPQAAPSLQRSNLQLPSEVAAERAAATAAAAAGRAALLAALAEVYVQAGQRVQRQAGGVPRRRGCAAASGPEAGGSARKHATLIYLQSRAGSRACGGRMRQAAGWWAHAGRARGVRRR